MAVANPHIAVIRLTESGSFHPTARDTLIVAPGMGTAVQSLYFEMAQELADRFQVIGIDLPGHGESPVHQESLTISELAGSVAQLVKNLLSTGTIRPGSRVYFAGLSISGQIALQLALDHAQLFAGIAVMASAAKIGTAEDWRERAEIVELSGTESMVEMSASLWVAEGFHGSDTIELQKQTLANADDQSYAELCRAIGAFDATDRLAEISLPIITIAGAQDQMCTVADARAIADGVQHGSTAVIENAAHLLPLEHPEQLAKLLDQHFS